MSGEQILQMQNILTCTSCELFAAKTLQDKKLALKVEKASEATSKCGNSTYLKNNSKLIDSSMYLQRNYEYECRHFTVKLSFGWAVLLRKCTL